MKSSEIIKLLSEKEVTQTDIADSLDPPVRQPAVNQVIHKRQTSRRIQDRICEVIGVSREIVWLSDN